MLQVNIDFAGIFYTKESADQRSLLRIAWMQSAGNNFDRSGLLAGVEIFDNFVE